MGGVRSYYVVTRNRDGSVIPATGRKELVSSRCSTSIMAYHLMLALNEGHAQREGRIIASKLPPEITPDGPVERRKRAKRRRNR